MCEKFCYENKWQAAASAKRQEERALKPFRVYMCNLCNKWHLSSQEKRGKRAKTQAYEHIDKVMAMWKRENEKRASVPVLMTASPKYNRQSLIIHLGHNLSSFCVCFIEY